ncbi:MAG: hypothetical protein M5U09_09345 [Gammaproteobacteria bacterium]|nr:hypothetical protein [Gammaproteobacteria bacterium]
MVRPYLPRFLREGDRAEIRVAVDNASETKLTGEVRFRIEDPDTKRDLSAEFGLPAGGGSAQFAAEAGLGTPGLPGRGARRRAPPRLPGRSARRRPLGRRAAADPGAALAHPPRPVALRRAHRRRAARADLRGPGAEDPTRIDERMVVTIDGQLFYGLLGALPYLVEYPYECTEQTLNRFVSAGVLDLDVRPPPGVRSMAAELSKRDTRWERFDAADPNRRMALEETLAAPGARRPGVEDEALLRCSIRRSPAPCAPRRSPSSRRRSSTGCLPWFPGGPPSPYMTLYLMYGLARASEFGVEVPEPMVRRGWTFLAQQIEREWWRDAIARDCCWELITFANYVASSYPDPKWMASVFCREASARDPRLLVQALEAALADAQAAARAHPHPDGAPAGRASGAGERHGLLEDRPRPRHLVGAGGPRLALVQRHDRDPRLGAARALRGRPEDARDRGLVQWLFLNKKLGHWKSTRATAEVLFSVAAWLQKKELLGAREEIAVTFGGRTTPFVFEPDRYTGKKNQIVLEGDEIVPERDATIVVEQKTEGVRLRLGDLALLDRSSFPKRPAATSSRSSGAGSGGSSRGRDDARAARRRGAPRRRRRARGAAVGAGEGRGRVRPPARSARGRARARPLEFRLALGSRHRLVRGGARLRHQLLLRVAAGRRLHAQVPRARPRPPASSGGTRRAPVDVRAGVRRLLGRGEALHRAGRLRFGRLAAEQHLGEPRPDPAHRSVQVEGRDQQQQADHREIGSASATVSGFQNPRSIEPPAARANGAASRPPEIASEAT